jgi:Chalcone isomerase-like
MTRFGLPTAALVAAMLAAPSLQAAEVAGVRVDDLAKAGNTDLVLNGAGIRTKVFFKVYVGALYLPKKTNSAAAIIDSKEPRRVVLHMLRDLDADSLFGALLDGLKKNHGEAELSKLKSDIDQFERIMRGIGTAKTGDIIGIDLVSDGLSVTFNGQPRGSVGSEAFQKALLKVWLGDKPADGDLKRAMLGG